jgi:magnesium transporter
MSADACCDVYRNGALEAAKIAPRDLPGYLDESDGTRWIDVHQPSRDRMKELAAILGLPEGALAAAVDPTSSPGLQRYPSSVVTTVSAVAVDADTAALSEAVVGLCLGETHLVTLRDSDDFPVDLVLERWNALSDLKEHGTDTLVISLLDVVNDGYVTCLETIYDHYDKSAEALRERFARKEYARVPGHVNEGLAWRDTLSQLHRRVIPLGETTRGLASDPGIDDDHELDPYRRDLYRQLRRINEEIEAIRALASDVGDSAWSMQNYRQELIAKKVAGWAAILTIPALITGYYGTNVNYPSTGTGWGFVVMMIILIGLPCLTYFGFRKNHWL